MKTGRESEDLVKVQDGQKVAHLSFDPQRLIQALTLGAVSIAAGVVDGILTPAVVASSFVSAQSGGATRGQRIYDPGFVIAELWKIPRVCPEDVSQFRPRFTRPWGLAVRHGSTPASPRLSIGRAGSSSD
jgi:hypothetical protein